MRLTCLAALLAASLTLTGASKNEANPETVTPWPTIQTDDHIVYRSSMDFPMNADALSDWIATGRKILVARQQSRNFETPVDAEYLSGHWPRKDAIRRLVMDDGHTSMERVLRFDPHYFRFQTWNMTRPDRAGLDYLVGEYRLIPLTDTSSRLTWTYSIHPNDAYLSAGTKSVVEGQLQQLMDDTLVMLSILAMEELEIASIPAADVPEPPVDYDNEPAIADTGHVSIVERRVFHKSLEDLRAWMNGNNKFLAALRNTDNFKKPVEATLLKGRWPESGAVRRLRFKDGNFALQRVIENSRSEFRYIVWNFTSVPGSKTGYTYAVQTYNPLSDDRTEMVLTYHFMPDEEGNRDAMKRLIEQDYHPVIDSALDELVRQSDGVLETGQ